MTDKEKLKLIKRISFVAQEYAPENCEGCAARITMALDAIDEICAFGGADEE